MRNMIKLLNIQLTGMLGINRFLHTRDKGTKARMALIGVTVLIGVGVLAAALFMLCDTVLPVLRTLRMTGLLPPMLYALSSVMCLITSLQTGAGALFDTRDVQILLPMPLRTRTIVCARLMGLYVVDLLVELVAFVPVMVQYARYTNALPGAYIAACVLGALSLPVLPLLLGTALGTLIRSAAARFRHSNIVAIILLCVFSLGAMAFSFSISFSSMDSIDIGKILRITQTVTDAIVRLYPPTLLFVWAVEGSWAAAIGLFALSALCFALTVAVLGHFYLPLHGRIGASGAARRGVKANVWRAHTPSMALLAREGRRMLASPIYAVNTTFGLLLMMVFAGAMWFFGDRLFALIAVGELAGVDVRAYVCAGAAYILFLFTTMMPTTCVSISLEGAAFTTLRAMPVRARTLFAAKAAYNMLLMLPAVLISAALLTGALGLSGVNALSCFLLPLSGVLLAPSWGLIANLLFPRFDWKSETEVVKQGASALVGMLGAFLLSLAPMFLLFYLGADLSTAALWLSLAYTALSGVCWVVLLTWGEKRLERI